MFTPGTGKTDVQPSRAMLGVISAILLSRAVPAFGSARARAVHSWRDEDLFCACRVPWPVRGATMNTNTPQLEKAPACSVPPRWLPAVSGGSCSLGS